MPAVEAEIRGVLKKNFSLAAFLPETKEIIGVVILNPKARMIE
jgi:hypothetical protein